MRTSVRHISFLLLIVFTPFLGISQDVKKKQGVWGISLGAEYLNDKNAARPLTNTFSIFGQFHTSKRSALNLSLTAAQRYYGNPNSQFIDLSTFVTNREFREDAISLGGFVKIFGNLRKLRYFVGYGFVNRFAYTKKGTQVVVVNPFFGPTYEETQFINKKKVELYPGVNMACGFEFHASEKLYIDFQLGKTWMFLLREPSRSFGAHQSAGDMRNTFFKLGIGYFFKFKVPNIEPGEYDHKYDGNIWSVPF